MVFVLTSITNLFLDFFKFISFFIESTDNQNNNYAQKKYYAKRSIRDNVIGAWQPCKLLDTLENHPKYIVEFLHDGEQMNVAEHELASENIPDHSAVSDIGTRVIAKRCSKELPYIVNDKFQRVPLLPSQDDEFYPGIIAFVSGNRFMVFFDDGPVQFVKLDFIRRVKGDDSYNHGMCDSYSSICSKPNLFFIPRHTNLNR